MARGIFSNHIGGSSELTILADIRPEFVPVTKQVTYAGRLRAHLRMLGSLRRSGLETLRAGTYIGPVDSLRTLQFVRWTLIDDDTRMLLSVNFDRALEPYVRRIVEFAGPLLDTILCHCVDFEGRSSDRGFEGFISFARQYQVPVDLFAAAAPDISVDDGDYLTELDSGLRGPDAVTDPVAFHAGLKFKKPREKLQRSVDDAPLALLDQSLNIMRAFYERADLFPETSGDPDVTSELELYYNLAGTLLPGFWSFLQQKILGSAAAAQGPLTTEKDILGLLEHADNNPDPATDPLFAAFREPLRWFARAPRRVRNNTAAFEASTNLVQRGLLHKEARTGPVEVQTDPIKGTHACLLLLRVEDADKGGAFLRQMRGRLWPDAPQKAEGIPNSEISHTLSLTHSGLKSLHIPEEERLSFPLSFREGMDERAGLLGDTGPNHPQEWTWPLGNWSSTGLVQQGIPIAPGSVDLIIELEAALPDAQPHPDFDGGHPLLAEITKIAGEAAEHGVTLLAVEPMHMRPGEKVGHLGFRDGISQPKHGVDNPGNDPEFAPLGDLLIGHETSFFADWGRNSPEPALRDGTFQVIRKVSLDVAGFHRQSAKFASPDGAVTAGDVQEKMIGRRRDGDTLGPDGKAPLDYETDAVGIVTPLQSHIRRANPREDDTPRILRRGYSYGPFDEPEDAKRGLFFICYNANLAEQFEVIQRWISGGNSTGISSWHGDPLLAPQRPGGVRQFRFPHDNGVVTVPLGETPVALLEWGLYAFVPSKLGLEALADLAGTGAGPDSVGSAAPEPKRAEPATELARWKLLLEDTDQENRDRREAFWADLRVDGGQAQTEYGLLVGSKVGVREVLENAERAYSNRTYLERMTASIGAQYLGLDAGSKHSEESALFNRFLDDLNPGAVFGVARTKSRAVIRQLSDEGQPLLENGKDSTAQPKPLGKRIEAERFIYDTSAKLCESWFGLPADKIKLGGPAPGRLAGDPDNKPHCPHDILPASFYVFGPHPTDTVRDQAQTRTPGFVAAVEAHVAAGAPGGVGGLLAYLRAQAPQWSNRKMAELICGASFGLVGPLTGSFRSILYDWIEEGTLWRLHQKYHAVWRDMGGEPGYAEMSDLLRPEILKSMGRRPVPDLLHRAAQGNEPEDRVVISLRSAIADGGDPEYFLFGGNYEAPSVTSPIHKCPGKTMSLAALTGCFAALFEAEKLYPDGPLSFWLRPG